MSEASFIGTCVEKISIIAHKILFFDVVFWTDKYSFPFLIAWLFTASVFFSLRFRLVNFVYLKESILSVISPKINAQQLAIREKLRTSDQETSRRIIWLNIGSTVDLGSIFGVATVISIAGPGVIFWIIVSGFLSASIRFAEVVAAHIYRIKNADNLTEGGPQLYLIPAFARFHMRKLGKFVNAAFSILLLASTFCSIQLNQTVQTIIHFAPQCKQHTLVIAAICAAIICAMLFLGFGKITAFANKMVPLITQAYLITTIIILCKHHSMIVVALKTILQDAMNPISGITGVIAAFVLGMQRAFFCNETGMGSAAIAHAKTLNTNAVSEGIISMLTPIVTSIVICTCSGLIVTVTQSYLQHKEGIAMMAHAFNTVHPYFSLALLVIVPLFGLFTAIAWAYYGQTIWKHICPGNYAFIYNILLLLSYTACGATENFYAVLNLADAINLSIAIPNIMGLYLLSGMIASKLTEYKSNQLSGMAKFKQSALTL